VLANAKHCVAVIIRSRIIIDVDRLTIRGVRMRYRSEGSHVRYDGTFGRSSGLQLRLEFGALPDFGVCQARSPIH